MACLRDRPWRIIAVLTVLFLLPSAASARGCPSSTRVDLPDCVDTDWGFGDAPYDECQNMPATNQYWYRVKNGCPKGLTVKVDVKNTYDDKFWLKAGETECKQPVQGKVRSIKCCSQEGPCYQTASSPEDPDSDPATEDDWLIAIENACLSSWEDSPAATSGKGELLSHSAIGGKNVSALEWQCVLNIECAAASMAWKVHDRTLLLYEVKYLRCCDGGALKTGSC